MARELLFVTTNARIKLPLMSLPRNFISKCKFFNFYRGKKISPELQLFLGVPFQEAFTEKSFKGYKNDRSKEVFRLTSCL